MTDGSVTKAEFARHVGVAGSLITKWIANGMPVLPGGRINRDAASDWIDDNVKRKDGPLRPWAADVDIPAVFALKLVATGAAVVAFEHGATREDAECAGIDRLLQALFILERRQSMRFKDGELAGWQSWIRWDRINQRNSPTRKDA